MPHTDNSKSQETSHLSCHASTDTSKLQSIVYLAMPHTDTNKSQATNHTSCQCLTQIPADHGSKKSFISHDTSKSQATSRASCHVSHIYQQITGSKSYILLTMPQTDTSTSWATKRTPYHASQRYRQYIVHLAVPDTYHRGLLLFLNRTRSRCCPLPGILVCHSVVRFWRMSVTMMSASEGFGLLSRCCPLLGVFVCHGVVRF